MGSQMTPEDLGSAIRMIEDSDALNFWEAFMEMGCDPRADLAGADLAGVDLSGAQLSEANLRETDFSRANLSNSDLSGADLVGASLRGADLTNANLSGADLTNADLAEANLVTANLTGARLVGTEVKGTDRREAFPDGGVGEASAKEPDAEFEPARGRRKGPKTKLGSTRGASRKTAVELIISRSRTRAAAMSCNVSGEFYGALDEAVRGMIKEAEARAKANKRNTLKACDLEAPRSEKNRRGKKKEES